MTPNLEAVFSIEKVFESTFQYALKQAGIDRVYISRETMTFETPCAEVKVINGDANKLHQYQPSAGAALYDSWDGALEVRVKTNRGTNGAQHVILLAKVRAALTIRTLIPIWEATDAAKLHGLTDIREMKGDSQFDSDSNIDTTIIPYYILPNIDPKKWPIGM